MSSTNRLTVVFFHGAGLVGTGRQRAGSPRWTTAPLMDDDGKVAVAVNLSSKLKIVPIGGVYGDFGLGSAPGRASDPRKWRSQERICPFARRAASRSRVSTQPFPRRLVDHRGEVVQVSGNHAAHEANGFTPPILVAPIDRVRQNLGQDDHFAALLGDQIVHDGVAQ